MRYKMKRYIIYLVCLLILVTGCLSNKDNSLVKKELSNKVVLQYRANNTGLDSEPYYEIDVYADKYITYGYSHLDGFSKVELTDDEYQEIVDDEIQSFEAAVPGRIEEIDMADAFFPDEGNDIAFPEIFRIFADSFRQSVTCVVNSTHLYSPN